MLNPRPVTPRPRRPRTPPIRSCRPTRRRRKRPSPRPRPARRRAPSIRALTAPWTWSVAASPS
ncbi:MAG: hypothetical protein EON89_10990, partial [Brevundimonas sp.]